MLTRACVWCAGPRAQLTRLYQRALGKISRFWKRLTSPGCDEELAAYLCAAQQAGRVSPAEFAWEMQTHPNCSQSATHIRCVSWGWLSRESPLSLQTWKQEGAWGAHVHGEAWGDSPKFTVFISTYINKLKFQSWPHLPTHQNRIYFWVDIHRIGL